MSRLRRAFGVVSADVARDPALSMSAKALYLALCTYADEDGVCYPSNETLARDLRVSDRTVRTLLTELCEASVIARQERYSNQRQINSTTTLTDAVTNRVAVDDLPARKQASTRGEPQIPPGGEVDFLQNKTSRNKKEPAKKPPASERARRSAQPLIAAWVEGGDDNGTKAPQTMVRRFAGNARELVNELRRQHGTLTDVPDREWQRAQDTARHLGANGWVNLVAQFFGEDGKPPTLPVDGAYMLYDDGTFATW